MELVLVNSILIIVGLLFIVISFFFKTKDNKDIQDGESNKKIEYNNENSLDEINELSQVVMGEIDSKHKEVLHIYEMIDKKESDLKAIYEDVKDENKEVREETSGEIIEERNINSDKDDKEVKEFDSSKFDDYDNHNNKIIQKYNEGMELENIAKELGLGIGEVQLVIGLYSK